MVGDGEDKREVSQLLFADDTVLVAYCKEIFDRLVGDFGRDCRRRKLTANVAKSKVMKSVSVGIVGEMNIVIDGQVLEEVGSFKHQIVRYWEQWKVYSRIGQ